MLILLTAVATAFKCIPFKLFLCGFCCDWSWFLLWSWLLLWLWLLQQCWISTLSKRSEACGHHIDSHFLCDKGADSTVFLQTCSRLLHDCVSAVWTVLLWFRAHVFLVFKWSAMRHLNNIDFSLTFMFKSTMEASYSVGRFQCCAVITCTSIRVALCSHKRWLLPWWSALGSWS